MIGLGCGARSYTQQLHYETRFATTQAGIRAILREWIVLSDEELAQATHGIRLSGDEQQRRFLILSLLQAEGLSVKEFDERFPGVVIDDIPELAELIERGWLVRMADRYVLTPAGMQHSDVVGPLLYSPSVRDRLRAFVDFPAVLEGAPP
jgi:oxygen-independent coproporphyrinogen-3 oxidase